MVDLSYIQAYDKLNLIYLHIIIILTKVQVMFILLIFYAGLKNTSLERWKVALWWVETG